jgi:hypothetical protein
VDHEHGSSRFDADNSPARRVSSSEDRASSAWPDLAGDAVRMRGSSERLSEPISGVRYRNATGYKLWRSLPERRVTIGLLAGLLISVVALAIAGDRNSERPAVDAATLRRPEARERAAYAHQAEDSAQSQRRATLPVHRGTARRRPDNRSARRRHTGAKQRAAKTKNPSEGSASTEATHPPTLPSETSPPPIVPSLPTLPAAGSRVGGEFGPES